MPKRLGVNLNLVTQPLHHYGMFVGVVEDVTDPLKLFRVRVRVPEIFGDASAVPTNHLPWAHPSVPPGSFRAPEVGDQVTVHFLKGDIHYPIWTGMVPRGPEARFDIPRGRLPNLDDPPLNFLIPSFNLSSVRSFITSHLGQGIASKLGQIGYDFTTVTKSVISKLVGLAKNTVTYYKPPTQEVPEESKTSTTMDPTISICFKSRCGHTIVYSDDPGNEYLKIIDRAGQEIIFDCPIQSSLQNNNSMYRGTDEAVNGSAINPSNSANSPAGFRIRIIDAKSQEIQMYASDLGSKISLMGLSSSIVLDSTPGANGVTISDNLGNSVTMGTSGITLTSLNNTGPVNILATELNLNGVPIIVP